MKRTRTSKLLNSKKIKLVTIIALFVLLGSVAWVLNSPNQQNTTSTDTPTEKTSIDQMPSSISPNLDPPTNKEKQQTEDYKKALAETNNTSTNTTPSGKKLVYPVITSANHEEVRAYVSGVIEDGGTCTATATKGSQVKTASSLGAGDASYTGCGPISLSLPSGTWSVVVRYSSASYEGKSQAFEVE